MQKKLVRAGVKDRKVLAKIFDRRSRNVVRLNAKRFLPESLVKKAERVEGHESLSLEGKLEKTHENHSTDVAILAKKIAEIQSQLYRSFDFRNGGLKIKAKTSLRKLGFSRAEIKELEGELRSHTLVHERKTGSDNGEKIELAKPIPAVTMDGERVNEILSWWERDSFAIPEHAGYLHDVGKARRGIIELVHGRPFSLGDRQLMGMHEEASEKDILKEFKEPDRLRKLFAFAARHHTFTATLAKHRKFVSLVQKNGRIREGLHEQAFLARLIHDADSFVAITQRRGTYMPDMSLRQVLGEVISPLRNDYQPISPLNKFALLTLVRMANTSTSQLSYSGKAR
ncbi:TPA: HD domain-containing protein [Candidatus Micrarchaeota archaeon]|nr:HD domain-containing protein [Candidatus Micrarchaeota archaeon]